MTDAELIHCFLAGERDIFNTLIQRWQTRLYNFILRHSGDPEEARDLCQQAFIRAYRHLDRLHDPQRFSTWIYQIAANLCRDYHRRGKAHASLEAYQEDHGRPHPALAGAAAATGDLHRNQIRALLNRALQQLPEEQRLVVVLKEYQGLKFSEIAEVLDTPINTVKSRLYYGLKALRKTFEQWNIDEEHISYEM